MRGGTLSDDANKKLADGLAQAATEINGRAEQIGVPYGTDASVIARAGVSAVVFGPGSIKQAHTADEWVPVDELKLAAETLYRFASRNYPLT
jgi:acetylornithine deacetylase